MSDENTFSGPGAPITTYMAEEVVTLGADSSLTEVARLIADASIGCVVVGSVDEVEAVISERDIVRAVAEGRDLDATTAGELGSHRIVWASADDTIGDVAEEMMEDYVRHVLVRADGCLVGVVSMRDVISALTV
jgi:CBS domain-containing protein